MDTSSPVAPVLIGEKPAPIKPVAVTIRHDGESIRLKVYGYTGRQVADALKKALA